ncbi:hypothetical protein SAMN04487936_106164 [Halobacillus dabanensis]|uniref:DUF309 domain-containing protein n=1 Tax=Halobacillus dabanensis TaxID=240302 RepID=A0A1I3W2A1_HALDA|nr:DUF309 domain-containing protein [Halobacillus dabanensis]SFK01728.1 hypothetical protein SAMN04487936_106164 [Halobacillus dabanensis]
MYAKAYIGYLAHFHGTRDYFECHEVLEEHWKAVDPKNRSSVWVLLIQIAVSMYHARRGNLKGARTLMGRCLRNIPDHTAELEKLGLDAKHLEKQLNTANRHFLHKRPYRSWNMPIKDLYLRKEVQILCQHWNVSYGSPSDLSNDDLVHKHKRRA